MKHFILNLANGDRAQAASRLQAKTWALARDERHCRALAPGDRVLIHVARPGCAFIGRAVLATDFQDRTGSGAQAPSDGPSGGVWLTDVEEWPRAVLLEAVVQRIDPTASNPAVQANARGFRSGIVQITAPEYDAVVALACETRQT